MVEMTVPENDPALLRYSFGKLQLARSKRKTAERPCPNQLSITGAAVA